MSENYETKDSKEKKESWGDKGSDKTTKTNDNAKVKEALVKITPTPSKK
jgi:hypothetical protein